MPTINLALSEDDYHQLREEYKKMALAWPKPGLASLPPTFEEWVTTRAMAANNVADGGSLDDLRVFAAIEKLITSLRTHGFGLAHLGKHDRPSSSGSAQELAESIVSDLKLPQQQLKRIQELVDYYSKGAKEIADMAQVGITNRAYGALHEAYRELLERTDQAVERLGEERAIGRVEGAVAILVTTHVMDRQTAQEKTEAFKMQARNPKKRSM
jgi:hypothetical protein